MMKSMWKKAAMAVVLATVAAGQNGQAMGKKEWDLDCTIWSMGKNVEVEMKNLSDNLDSLKALSCEVLCHVFQKAQEELGLGGSLKEEILDWVPTLVEHAFTGDTSGSFHTAFNGQFAPSCYIHTIKDGKLSWIGRSSFGLLNEIEVRFMLSKKEEIAS